MVTEAIILAGGLGTRLRDAVPDLPKPMAPVRGLPFLEHLLAYWRQQGVERFVLAVGYRAEFIEGHFGATVTYSRETSPLGTGGGLALALGRVPPQSTTLVVNGDTFLDLDLDEFHDSFLAERADLAMAMTRVREGWINGGVYLVGARAKHVLSRIPAPFSLEHDFFAKLPETDLRMTNFETGGAFLDIGTPETYARASMLQFGRHP